MQLTSDSSLPFLAAANHMMKESACLSQPGHNPLLLGILRYWLVHQWIIHKIIWPI